MKKEDTILNNQLLVFPQWISLAAGAEWGVSLKGEITDSEQSNVKTHALTIHDEAEQKKRTTRRLASRNWWWWMDDELMMTTSFSFSFC